MWIPVNRTAARGLVADVQLEQNGGEGLDGRRVRQLTRVERPQVRDLGDDVARRLCRGDVIGADEHVALDRCVEIAELLRRHVMQRGGYARSGHGRLHARRDRATRGNQRLELVADLGERVRHGDHHLALQLRRHRLGRHRRRIPWRGDDHDLGVRRAFVVGGVDGETSIRPGIEQRVSHLHGAIARPRTDHDLESHRSEPSGQAAPCRTRCTQNADLHGMNVVEEDGNGSRRGG